MTNRTAEKHFIWFVAFMATALPLVCRASVNNVLRGQGSSAYAVAHNQQFIVYTTVSSRLHDVYRLELPTHRKTKLFSTTRYINSLSISNDDCTIYFTASKHGVIPSSIFSYSIPANTIKQLTTGHSFDFAPVQVPGIQTVIFIRSRKSREWSMGGTLGIDWNVCTLNLSDHIVKVICPINLDTFTGFPQMNSAHTQVLGSDSIGVFTIHLSHPTVLDYLAQGKTYSEQLVSPDGKFIYSISDKSKLYDYEIWRMNPDGSGTKPLTHMHSCIQDIQLTDSGQYLYFRSDITRSSHNDLYKMNTQTFQVSLVQNSRIFN